MAWRYRSGNHKGLENHDDWLTNDTSGRTDYSTNLAFEKYKSWEEYKEQVKDEKKSEASLPRIEGLDQNNRLRFRRMIAGDESDDD